MPALPADLLLSQSALADFAECPLRFRYRYLDGVRLPEATAPEVRTRVERGRAFHLLAHRHFAGLEPVVPPGVPHAAELAEWVRALHRFCSPRPDRTYLPEFELGLRAPDLPLAARYDLLVLEPDGRRTIYDWKTSPLPPSGRLAASLQTRVYRLVLALAGPPYAPAAPEDIRMVYWYPGDPDQPAVLSYSAELLAEDAAVVGELVRRLRDTPAAAMAATDDDSVCRHCTYRPLCFGAAREEVAEEEEASEILATFSWDDLPEVNP
ncbi:PD-(D/E)XK nuclease family protein [Caldinitratiruptor microaerophilus]|uniref:PD-(D/E)XK endonuclease-like domain-containing protein n=1 Tax=Caldinitratiruptor microaerophilus TaxID=671077 RepID=A0AA35G8C2_9FIRM|nr:PD-(D/E)XK nuclease family protein [Caldinitratiruptor microaerophilus]BDG59119.1 hypothetical protein caldi_02090 [Caldinitratiruptor microaerophilus]